MFPVLQIGPAALQTPGLLLLLGVFVGLGLSEHFARRQGRDAEALTNLVLIVLLSGVVAARLAYAVTHFSLFRHNPSALVAIDTSLLDPWGGLAGGIIAALVYGQRRQLGFWSSLDGLTPLLAVLAVFAGLSHMASGQAYGAPTSLPWGIPLWGARRQPSQVYETLGAVAVLAALWRQFSRSAGSGRLFLRFAALSSGMFVFLQAFRGDSPATLAGFRPGQLLGLAGLGLALILLEIRSRPGRFTAEESPSIQ